MEKVLRKYVKNYNGSNFNEAVEAKFKSFEEEKDLVAAKERKCQIAQEAMKKRFEKHKPKLTDEKSVKEKVEKLQRANLDLRNAKLHLEKKLDRSNSDFNLLKKKLDKNVEDSDIIRGDALKERQKLLSSLREIDDLTKKLTEKKYLEVELEKIKAEKNAEKESLSQETKKLYQEKSELLKQIDQNRSKMDMMYSKQDYDKKLQELSTIKDNLKQLNDKYTKVVNENKSMIDKASKNAVKDSEISNLKAKLKEKDKSLENMEEKNSDLKKDLTMKEEELDKLFNDRENQIDEKEQEISRLQKEKDQEVKRLEGEVQGLKDKYQKDFDGYQKVMESISSVNKTGENSTEQLQKDRDDAILKATNAEKDRKNQVAENENLNAELQEIRFERDKLKTELDKQCEEIKDMKATIRVLSTLNQPAPTPVQHVAPPVQPSPAPVQHVPTPVQPAPTPAQLVPTSISMTDQGLQSSNQRPDTVHSTHAQPVNNVNIPQTMHSSYQNIHPPPYNQQIARGGQVQLMRHEVFHQPGAYPPQSVANIQRLPNARPPLHILSQSHVQSVNIQGPGSQFAQSPRPQFAAQRQSILVNQPTIQQPNVMMQQRPSRPNILQRPQRPQSQPNFPKIRAKPTSALMPAPVQVQVVPSTSVQNVSQPQVSVSVVENIQISENSQGPLAAPNTASNDNQKLRDHRAQVARNWLNKKVGAYNDREKKFYEKVYKDSLEIINVEGDEDDEDMMMSLFETSLEQFKVFCEDEELEQTRQEDILRIAINMAFLDVTKICPDYESMVPKPK